jgi:hypothetical protein
MFILLVKTIIVPRCDHVQWTSNASISRLGSCIHITFTSAPIQIQLSLVINGVDMLSFIECNNRFLFACILCVY